MHALQMERLHVSTLPSTSASRGARWDAWQLLRFGEDVLTWMSQAAQQHAPGQHLRFEFPGSGEAGAPRATNRSQGTAQQPLLITCQVLQDGHLPEVLAQVLPATV
jgi:hypothetical protein